MNIPIIINRVKIDHSVLATLEYFQGDNNTALKQDIATLKEILLLLCLPDNDNMPLNDERIRLLEGLSCFIQMIDGIKHK